MYEINYVLRATNTATGETIEQGFYSDAEASNLEHWLDTLGVAYEWFIRGQEGFPYERYPELT